MPAGAFLNPVLLGTPGEEMSLNVTNQALIAGAFSETLGRTSVDLSTVVGDGFSAVHGRHRPKYKLTIPFANFTTLGAIRSMYAVGDSALSFVFADDWLIPTERYLTATTTTVQLDGSCYTKLDRLYDDLSLSEIVKITGVFTDRNFRGAQVSSNLFAGGSYDRQTRIITLGTSPGPAGTIVFINYTFRGCTVRFRGAPKSTVTRSVDLGARLFKITANLESV